jgi:signal transduction histidine kinase
MKKDFLKPKEQMFAAQKIHGIERLAEFGNLASGIFHDLMNPLTNIMMAVEKIKESPAFRDEKIRECVDQALRASEKIKSLVQVAKKGLVVGERKETFFPEKEILEAIELLTYKARKSGIDVTFNISSHSTLYGNPVKFFRVMINLISNAIDSYLDFKQGEKIVLIKSWSDSSFFFAQVKDYGCGIEAKVLEKIFDPFFTTKPDGSGLGLTTTKQIIEMELGGAISIQSAPQRGSTFTIQIPLETVQLGNETGPFDSRDQR